VTKDRLAAFSDGVLAIIIMNRAGFAGGHLV